MYWACSKEVAPSKWPAINKISFVLQYFYYIVHFDFSLQEVLHIWYQSTFLGTSGKFFFWRKKKGQNWAATFTSIFETFCVDSRKISCISQFLFKKYAISKNNHLIWSSKSWDIADLKSAIFQNFGDGRGNCRAKIFCPGAQISISKIRNLKKQIISFGVLKVEISRI